MLIGLLTTLYLTVSLLLIPLILIQKGKGSVGLGSLGGGTQMLFGGSGGQDVFQKLTWILGAIFMAGSLILATLKSPNTQTSRYLNTQQQAHVPRQETPDNQ